MAVVMEKPRDVVGGVVIMAIGVGFLLFGQELEMGTSVRMGPGYFPTILSVIMIALGLLIAVLGLRGPTGESGPSALPWRGLILIIGATLVFGLTLRGLGLAPVLVLTVLGTAWASRYASLRSSLLLSVGLAAFCSMLFIRLLGLPLPLVGPWVSTGYWMPEATAPASEAASGSVPPTANAPRQ